MPTSNNYLKDTRKEMEEVKHCSHLFHSHIVNKYTPLLKIAVMELEEFYYKDK